MKTNVFVFLMALFAITALRAQNFNSCGQWAEWDVNGYTIYNNIWGSGAGSQCIWAYDESNWGVTADHPNTSGIKSYPNADYDVDYTVSSMPTITADFNVSTPGWGSYNTAFDIWYDDYAYEIMLWMNWNGEMGPISYNYGCSGYLSTACPVATNVNAGGHTWNVYEGTNGSATVYSFLRTSQTHSGTVDITAISQWLANNGYFSSNTNLHEIQFGFEISQSSGGADFTVNSYGVNVGSGGGSGGSGGSGGGSNGQFNGTYSIVASHSGKALDTYEWGTSNGTNIVQWNFWGGDAQRYNISQVDGDWHRITPIIASGQALDVNGISTSDGANIQTWSYWGGEGQQFRFQSAGSGLWQIVARHSGKCFDVEGGSSSDGANVIQWSCISGASNQMFELVSQNSANADLQSNEMEGAFELYPNPVSSTLQLNVPDHIENRIQVSIVNHVGQRIMELDQVSRGVNTFNVSSLEAGLYFAEVKYGTETKMLKFTKK